MSVIQHARKEGKVFQNPIPTSIMTGPVLKTLAAYLTAKAERVPLTPIGPFHTDTSVFNTLPESGLRITWIGHSSLLIELDGYRILTDPVWSQRVSFSSAVGPKRFFAPPLALSQLPSLDLIICSHDHYDHLDHQTIRQLALTNTPFVCSEGVGFYLEKWGVSRSRITELNWGDSTQVADELKITATPARHFSGRGIWNRNTTLWSSFVLKGPKHNIFFGADSGWFDGFRDIGDQFGPFDLTMLEIGAYGDTWPDIHMGPENASNAHLALRGKQMMPIHWGTFNLALHAWREPIERLLVAAKEKNITLFAPQPGLPTEANGEAVVSGWWK